MVGNVGNQENALRFGQRIEDVDMLDIVGIRRVGQGRKDGVDYDGEYVLQPRLIECTSDATVGCVSDLQLALDERRIGGADFQDVHNA